MRFYPTADIGFYVDVSEGWDRLCRTPHKSWKYKDRDNVRVINHWRDLVGCKMPVIKNKDIYELSKTWQKDRKRKAACLPIFYAVGNRFVLLTRDFPTGFKCRPMPMNLAEARVVRQKELEKAKAAEKVAKEAAKEAAKAEKAAKAAAMATKSTRKRKK